jgi:hypothetical protein
VGEQQHPRRRLHLRRNPTRPQTMTRSKDLRLEGTCRHHAWAIAARVSSGNLARADGSTGHFVASASCPPRTSAQLMASTTRLRRWSGQWTARLGSGRRSFFSSQLCLCPCWHRCLQLRLIAERPRVSLTKQEKPRAARPTEPRESYASGIRIPHTSPSHEATHTWLSGSASRHASPSARNEENTRLHAKIHKCSGPDSHDEQTPALKVPLPTELRFRPRRYEQPPTLEGLRGDKTPGGLPTPAPAAATTTSAPGGQTEAAMTSGRTLLRRAPRPRPHSRGEDKLSKPKSRRPGARMVVAISSATRTSPAATTSAPTTAAVCPPADPHSDPPGRASTDLRAEASYRSKGRTGQEHERYPSSAQRLGRSSGACGATTARTAGGGTGSRARAS